MLATFRVQNFHSFRNQEVLDLSLPGATPPDSPRFRRILPSEPARAPTVVAIFGANASGKTNLLRAMSFLANFIRGRASWEKSANAPFLTFNDIPFLGQPTTLACEVAGDIFGAGPSIYEYELSIRSEKGAGSAVEYESLKFAPNSKRRRLIERHRQDFSVGTDFELPKDDPRLGYVTEGTSVLTTLAKFNHPPSIKIIESLRAVFSNVDLVGAYPLGSVVDYYTGNPIVLERLKQRIRIMDMGITDVSIERVDQEPIVRFKHAGVDLPIPYSMESDGTRNFFSVFPLLNFALEYGGLVLIDELDRDIHPLLLPEIVGWFQDPKANPRDAQLIFTCHSAPLLESLEKEEIFFVEKTRNGHSHIYGLKDFQGVRRDMNLYKKYLGGAFGAVPRLG